MYVDREKEKVQSQKYYSVGYSSKLDKYLLIDVVPWIVWYERYYEISEEEYNMFGTESLDELVDRIRKVGTKSDRFLFSDMTEENTKEQLKLLNKAK